MKKTNSKAKIDIKENIDSTIFRSLFEHSISGILYGNPDTGCIYDANEAAAKMFGYTVDELRKLNRNDVFDYNHSSMIKSLKIRQENGSAKGELIGIRKNGEFFPCEFTSSIFKNKDDENRTCTILNDISERRKTEDEMTLLLDNTEESFVLIDKNLRIVSFNKLFLNKYKYLLNKEVKKGDSIIDYSIPERKTSIVNIYNLVLEGQTIEDIGEFVDPNGNTYSYNIIYKPARNCSGEVIGIFLTAHDTTAKMIAVKESIIEKRNKEALINLTFDLIWSVDLDFKLIAANQAFLNTMKIVLNSDLKPGDNLLFENGIDKNFISFWKQMYIRGFTGESFKFETITPRDYNNVVYLQTTINPIFDGDAVVGLACYSRDITEIKLAHIKLQDSSDLLNKLTEKLPTAIFQFEISKEGKAFFPYISKGIERLIPDLSVEKLNNSASSAFDSVHPDDLVKLMASIEASKINLVDWELDFRTILKNGKIVWLHGKSRPEQKEDGSIVWYGYFADVTEQKNNLEILELANSRYDIIAKATNDIVWDCNLVNQTIFWAKGVFGYANMNNYSTFDWWFDRIHPEDLERVKQKLKTVIDNNELRWEDEFRFKIADGSYRYIHDRGFILFHEAIPYRMIGAMQDITERKLVEKDKENVLNVLNRTSELAKIGGWEVDLVNNDHFWSNEIFNILELENGFIPSIDKVITFFSPQHRHIVKNAIYDCINEGLNWDLELQAFTSKGKPIWVRAQGSPIRKKHKTIKLLGTLQDITDRKSIEEQLKDTDLKFKTIIDSTPECIKLIHKSGELILINNAGLNMLELDSSDQLREKPLDSYVVPKYKIKANKLFENGFKGIEGVLQFELNTDKGNCIWVEANVVPMKKSDTAIDSILVVIRDITQKKKEEQFLKLLESVVTHTNDSVMITEAEPFDEPGPRIVYVNSAFTKMTGYLPEEVIGKSPRILQGDKTNREELKRVRESLQRWESCEATVINYKKTGEEFWINFSLKPIADSKGWYTHWISVERDVTEQKRNELEKEQIISELSQNNKDLKQFSYVTSHNLRAPIANLLGLTNLIDQYKIPNKSLKQIIDGVKQSALMFDDTIKDLSKVLVIKDQPNIIKEEVSFVVIIENVFKQLSISMDDNTVKINFEFMNAPFVLFNAAYLESVFLNLFTNAIKYKSTKRKLKIDIVSIADKDFIILKFKDNGIGIDTEKYKDKLFKLYQRFHDVPDGKGLGLYLVKSQLEALGGSIDVESEVDKGTTFIIKFKK
jgi:PAS domain S-box-containing protein